MYLVSVLDNGAERVIRAESVTLTSTDIVIVSDGLARVYRSSQLLELLIVEPRTDAPEAVIEAARAFIRKYRKSETLN
jgi:hypothetical protein